MKEIFKTNYINIVFDEKYKVVFTIWLDSIFTSEQYRDVWERTLDFGNKNDVNYFLSDIINQKVVLPNDRKWFEDDVIPRAIKTGIKKGAIILGWVLKISFFC